MLKLLFDNTTFYELNNNISLPIRREVLDLSESHRQEQIPEDISTMIESRILEDIVNMFRIFADVLLIAEKYTREWGKMK